MCSCVQTAVSRTCPARMCANRYNDCRQTETVQFTRNVSLNQMRFNPHTVVSLLPVSIQPKQYRRCAKTNAFGSTQYVSSSNEFQIRTVQPENWLYVPFYSNANEHSQSSTLQQRDAVICLMLIYMDCAMSLLWRILKQLEVKSTVRKLNAIDIRETHFMNAKNA